MLTAPNEHSFRLRTTPDPPVRSFQPGWLGVGLAAADAFVIWLPFLIVAELERLWPRRWLTVFDLVAVLKLMLKAKCRSMRLSNGLPLQQRCVSVDRSRAHALDSSMPGLRRCHPLRRHRYKDPLLVSLYSPDSAVRDNVLILSSNRH